MQNIIRSGTLNTNSPGPESPWPHGRGSRGEVGSQPTQLGELGTGSPSTPRNRLGSHRTANRREFGGQASGAGLFGIRLTGETSSAPKAAAVRSIQQTPQARPVVGDRPRRIGGLSFGQRRAIVCRPSPAEIERRNAAMRAAAIASDLRQEREWHEYAELVESHPTLPYGSVETACALND